MSGNKEFHVKIFITSQELSEISQAKQIKLREQSDDSFVRLSVFCLFWFVFFNGHKKIEKHESFQHYTRTHRVESAARRYEKELGNGGMDTGEAPSILSKQSNNELFQTSCSCQWPGFHFML